MNTTKIISIVLIVGGLLVLVYGGFNYPKTHEAKLGSMAFDVKTQEHVDVPIWAGAGAMVLGVLLLLAPIGKAGR